jgi:hypothetical protein
MARIELDHVTKLYPTAAKPSPAKPVATGPAPSKDATPPEAAA